MIGRAYIGSTAAQRDFARFQARLGQRGITVNLLSHEFGEVVDAVATSASRSAAEEKLGGTWVSALGVLSMPASNMPMITTTLTLPAGRKRREPECLVD